MMLKQRFVTGENKRVLRMIGSKRPWLWVHNRNQIRTKLEIYYYNRYRYL